MPLGGTQRILPCLDLSMPMLGFPGASHDVSVDSEKLPSPRLGKNVPIGYQGPPRVGEMGKPE